MKLKAAAGMGMKNSDTEVKKKETNNRNWFNG